MRWLKRLFGIIPPAESHISFSGYLWGGFTWLVWGGGSAAILGVLAVFAEPLRPYAPLSWGLVALSGGLMGIILYSIIGFGKKKRAEAAYLDAMSRPNLNLNPVDKTFEGRRINLVDLRMPLSSLVEDKVFKGCQIVGPCVVLTHETIFNKVTFNSCTFLKIEDGEVPIYPDVYLTGVILNESHLFSITFLFRRSEADRLVKEGLNIPWANC